jgi:hypothetical protein
VRTVSSNFGFAFGTSSAPTSSDATPTREIEAPPAKRRKTILSNELVVAEHTVERPVIAPKSTRAVKSRRRLPVDDFDEKAQSEAVTADDSFLAGLETKKARTAKTKAKKTPTPAHEAPVEVANVRSAASGRPRRLAAATAASKVSEGFEEEAAPIDRKRRDAAPIQKKSRKNQVFQAEEGCVLEDSIKGDDAATEPKRPLPKKQTAGRKRKAAVLDVVDEKDELAASVAVRGKGDTTSDENDKPEQALASKPAPKLRTGKGVRTEKKHKQNGKESTVQTRSSEDDFSHSIQQPPAVDIGPPTSPQSKRIPRRRQPLAEANMNITSRSSSPEKMQQDGSKLPIKPAPKSSRPSQSLPSSQKITKPANNKRRKLNVQRDAGQDTTKSPATVLQPDSRADTVVPVTTDSKETPVDRASRLANVSRPLRSANQSRSAGTTAKCRINLNKSENVEHTGAKRGVAKQTSTTLAQEDEAGRSPRIELRGNNAETTKLPNVRNSTKGNGNAAACRLDGAEDEDVDWLFAPQPQASTALKPSAAKSKAATASWKFKMPEMDLDDLLSNIATFAQVKPTSVPAVAHNSLFHSLEKGRGGGRKKAKV